jgi:hypothetical protein
MRCDKRSLISAEIGFMRWDSRLHTHLTSIKRNEEITELQNRLITDAVQHRENMQKKKILKNYKIFARGRICLKDL